MWFLQGLPKVIGKIAGGWDTYCTLNEFPQTFENNGLVCSALGKTMNFVNASSVTNKPDVPETTYQSLKGFDRFLTFIEEFFAGFKTCFRKLWNDL